MLNKKPELVGAFKGKEINCFGADGRLVVPATVLAGFSSRNAYFLCCPYLGTAEGIAGRCKAAALIGDSHLACIISTREAYEAIR